MAAAIVKIVTIKKHMTLVDRSVNTVIDWGEIHSHEMAALYELEKNGEAVCLLASPELMDTIAEALQKAEQHG